MNLSELLKRASLARAYEFLDKDPDQNIPRLLDWVEKLDKSGRIARQMPLVKTLILDPDSNWYRLLRSLWDDVDGEVRKTLFTNAVINGCLQIPPPVCMLAPGSAAWSFDALDNAVERGMRQGICLYTISKVGTELCKEDLIALCNEYADCVFLLLINATELDDAFAAELLRVKNCIPVLAVGDSGESEAVQRALMVLRGRGLLFGVSCLWGEGSCSEDLWNAYVDRLIYWGVKFVCLQHTPSDDCEKAARESADMDRQIALLRRSKPLVIVKFPEDFTPKSKNDEKRGQKGTQK